MHETMLEYAKSIRYIYIVNKSNTYIRNILIYSGTMLKVRARERRSHITTGISSFADPCMRPSMHEIMLEYIYIMLKVRARERRSYMPCRSSCHGETTEEIKSCHHSAGRQRPAYVVHDALQRGGPRIHCTIVATSQFSTPPT
jgi:hypothetical protein